MNSFTVGMNDLSRPALHLNPPSAPKVVPGWHFRYKAVPTSNVYKHEFEKFCFRINFNDQCDIS